jgi:PAS domain S-box-containing protein
MPGCRKAHWDNPGTLIPVKKDIRVVAGELQDDDGEGLVMRADIPVHEIKSIARGDTEKDQFAGQRDFQQSLEAERALLRTVIDNVPDLIFQKDREGRFVLANLSLARIVGLSDPKDMIGKTDLEAFPRGIAEKFMSDDRVVIETARRQDNIEEPVLSASGSLTWMLTTKVPLLDKTGRVTGLVGIGRDITSRKELEEKNQRLATLVECADDAIVGFDLNRRITVWNRAAERQLGS